MSREDVPEEYTRSALWIIALQAIDEVEGRNATRTKMHVDNRFSFLVTFDSSECNIARWKHHIS